MIEIRLLFKHIFFLTFKERYNKSLIKISEKVFVKITKLKICYKGTTMNSEIYFRIKFDNQFLYNEVLFVLFVKNTLISHLVNMVKKIEFGLFLIHYILNI